MKAASAMFMMEITEVDDDVLEAVGELANMVAGQAKAELEEYELTVGIPTIITAEDHDIRYPSEAQPISVPI